MPAYRLPPMPAACAVVATSPSAVMAIHHSLFMGVSSLDKSLGPVIGRSMPGREVGGAARAGSSRGAADPCDRLCRIPLRRRVRLLAGLYEVHGGATMAGQQVGHAGEHRGQ